MNNGYMVWPRMLSHAGEFKFWVFILIGGG